MATPLCKDCAFYDRNWPTDIRYARCRSPNNKQCTDAQLAVTGKAEKAPDGFCEINRQFPQLCSLQGKWFEPKRRKWWHVWR